jgi:ABC-2 type transport system permease protein
MEVIGSYIGFLFLGAGYIAVGVFISAGTENQLTAALVTFFSLLVILLLDSITQIFPADQMSGLIAAGVLAAAALLFLFINTRNWVITLGAVIVCGLAIGAFWLFNRGVYAGFLGKFLGWFSLNRRYQSFSMGLLEFDSLLYYASFSGLFLFLTVRLIEKRRWN